MHEVSQVLAQNYPQANNNLSNSDSDSPGVGPSPVVKTNTNTKTLKQVRSLAWLVAEKLNNQSRYRLYCKYAWKLPEATIHRNLEEVLEQQAKGKVNNAHTLFTWLCEQELAE